MTRASTQQMLRQIPASWAIGILVLLVVYWFAQPALNSRLGWHLPSLAGLLGEQEPKGATKATPEGPAKQAKPKRPPADDVHQTAPSPAEDKVGVPKPDARSSASDEPESDASGDKPTARSGAQPKPTEAAAKGKAGANSNKSDLLYGVLRHTGRQRYVSPEGLQYNPGSEEGHRLKHLERHLKDQPDRPGKHGVFDGDMPQVLKWIDDAYVRGKRRAKGVHTQEEDGRTIYEVPFSQQIGHIGGKDGQRDRHPASKRMRLVVDGERFITAFPY